MEPVSSIFGLPCLIVWADKINKFGWCLAGCRGCWLDSPHEIPSVTWIFHHSSFLILSHILDCLICTRKDMSIELLLNMMLWYGVGGTWLIYIWMWVGGLRYHLTVLIFFLALLCFFDSDSLFNYNLLVHRSCCVCCESQVSYHYSADFLGKRFVLISITHKGVCPTLFNIIRLLGWVYHFSLLIY